MTLASSSVATPSTLELARMVVFSTYMVTALPMYSTGVVTLKVTGSVSFTPSSTRVLEVVESYQTTLARVVRPSRRASSESVCCS